MDLTKYYELKHQPHNLRLLPDSVGGAELEERLALPPSSCSSLAAAAASRARSPPRSSSRQSSTSAETDALMLPHHFLDGAPPKPAMIDGGDGRMSDQRLEELYKER